MVFEEYFQWNEVEKEVVKVIFTLKTSDEYFNELREREREREGGMGDLLRSIFNLASLTSLFRTFLTWGI